MHLCEPVRVPARAVQSVGHVLQLLHNGVGGVVFCDPRAPVRLLPSVRVRQMLYGILRFFHQRFLEEGQCAAGLGEFRDIDRDLYDKIWQNQNLSILFCERNC